MKYLLIALFVGLLCAAAFALLVAQEVLRRRRQAARVADASDSPLARMFRENQAEYERNMREGTLAELPEGEPLREWVARDGELGWLGFSDYLFGLFFSGTRGDPGAVRAVRFGGDREPPLRRLPQPDERFGVDLSDAPVSDRALAALADFQGLAALNLQARAEVTDRSLKTVARMSDLSALDLRFTEVTGKGLAALRGLSALRYLAVCFHYDYDDAAPHVARLTGLLGLGGPGITDRALRALAPLTELARLELSGAVTDAGLAHLAPFARLVTLKVSSVEVSDAGLAQLPVLPAVETLTVNNFDTKLRGPGLVGLTRLAGLRRLNLAHNGLEAAGLEHLGGLARLKVLDLTANPITDAGLARLRLPAGLETLVLTKTRVTDAGLARLELPPSVGNLSLIDLPLTDACAEHLARFAELRHLNIMGTRFTLAGAQRLADALPGCTIQTSFPK